MNNQKVLIAGVAGFLGSHLADSLIASGFKVVGLDDWVSGNKHNIEHLKGNPLFDFVEANINQKLPETLFQEPWFAIVHVVNTEVVVPGTRIELNELLSNSFGVKNLLDLALRTKSRFVLTSTIDLYHGLASHTSLNHYYEDSEQASVLSYSEAKRYAEALCQEYATIYGLDVRVARLSETYGPRMNLQSPALMATLIKAGLEGKSLALEEVGSRMLYTTYYSDVIFGLNKLVVRDDEALKGGIFYLVNSEPVSVISVVLTVKESSPHPISIEFLPRVEEPLIDLPHLDLARSKNELYWESKITLQEGVKRTFDFFKEHDVYLQTESPAMFESPANDNPVLTETLAEEFELSMPQEPVPASMPTASESPKEMSIEDLAVPIEQDAEQETAPEETAISRDQEPVVLEKKEIKISKKPSKWLSLQKKSDGLMGTEGRKILSIKKRQPNKIVLTLFGIIMAVILWFVGLPILGLTGHSLLGWFHSQRAQGFAAQADFVNSQRSWQKVSENIDDAQFYWSKTAWWWKVFGQDETFVGISSLFEGATAASNSAMWGVAFVEDISPWWKPLVRGEDSDAFSADRTEERLAKAELSWRFFRQNIELSEKIFEEALRADLPKFIVQPGHQTVANLKAVNDFTRFDSASWKFLPEWFGYEGKQQIVVLLQNNHELRAGGGFIGSYALIEVQNGTISSLLIDDIYNPDGQLDVEVLKVMSPAPEPVKEFFSTDGLGLRDSNWWPDFSTTGQIFSKLYTEATGVTPKWVVGINLSVMEDLLALIGPITLPNSETTIDANNLFEKAEVASEVNFVPGSTGKKDFLTEVVQQLWLALFPIPEDKLFGLSNILGKQLFSRNIQAYSTVPSWQSAIAQSKIAGRVGETAGDYLSIVSSNVGGNKSNFWVDRVAEYSIFVDRNNHLKVKLTVTFTHRGQNETWPNGDYKDYLRLYVPKGIELSESTGFTGEAETYEESGKTVIAGLVEVPIQSSKHLTVTYSLPESIRLTGDSPYTLVIEGQPGIEPEPMIVRLGLPFHLELRDHAPLAVINEDQLTWELDVMNESKITVVVSEQQ